MLFEVGVVARDRQAASHSATSVARQALEMIVKGELVGNVVGAAGWMQSAPLAARWLAEVLSRSAVVTRASQHWTRSASQPKHSWVEHVCVCGTTHVRPLALATLGSQLLANALPQLEPARAPPWRWSRRIAWTAGRPPTCFANVCASASVSKTLRRLVFWIARSVVTCSASTHSSSARRGDWPPLPEDPLAQQDPADLARAAS